LKVLVVKKVEEVIAGDICAIELKVLKLVILLLIENPEGLKTIDMMSLQ
jgi:hypothetical protein